MGALIFALPQSDCQKVVGINVIFYPTQLQETWIFLLLHFMLYQTENDASYCCLEKWMAVKLPQIEKRRT